MLARRIHGAPVVDSRGRLVGVVSQTDLLRWHTESALGLATGSRRAPSAGGQATVRDVMTTAAHAVRPETSAAVAAALMIRRKMHRLLVVDRDLSPVGIVSAIDLLRLVPGLDRQLAQTRDPFRDDRGRRTVARRARKDGDRATAH